MKDEISAAVMFLTRLIGRNGHLPSDKIERFRDELSSVLTENFRDHWFPERPFKGQAYRCIRINESEHRDSKLETAARLCGLNYDDLRLPLELTIWVDPEEVCCRFGEFEGSYCTVASFKGGSPKNHLNEINPDELEQKSVERSQQATFEILGGRQFTKNFPVHKHHIKNFTTVFGIPHQSSFRSQYQALYGSSPPHQQSYAQNDSTFNSFYPSKYRRGTSFPVQNSSVSYPNGTGPSRSDRYHWVSKSVVKA